MSHQSPRREFDHERDFTPVARWKEVGLPWIERIRAQLETAKADAKVTSIRPIPGEDPDGVA